MTTEVKSESAKKNEDWMNSKWRPMMGWLYMGTCTFDFVIFPILWSLLQSTLGHPVTQWQPLTLQGAGLYHVAMGAVLGLAAFGRTQEKLAGANNGGLQPVGQSVTTTFGAPQAGFGAAPGGFGSPAPAFGATPTSSFGNNVPVGFGGAPRSTTSFGAPVSPMTSSTGKPMPMQPDQPEL
jgi:Holin of 3TMs, for gene-transfer release